MLTRVSRAFIVVEAVARRRHTEECDGENKKKRVVFVEASLDCPYWSLGLSLGGDTIARYGAMIELPRR